MAVNYVDGTLFITIPAYPVAAFIAAASSGAGWLSIIFPIVVAPLGYAYVMAWTAAIYQIIEFCIGKNKDAAIEPTFFKSWIIGPPLMIFYLLAPNLANIIGFGSVWFGSIWLAKNL